MREMERERRGEERREILAYLIVAPMMKIPGL
jgi:hypothetical protein